MRDGYSSLTSYRHLAKTDDVVCKRSAHKYICVCFLVIVFLKQNKEKQFVKSIVTVLVIKCICIKCMYMVLNNMVI